MTERAEVGARTPGPWHLNGAGFRIESRARGGFRGGFYRIADAYMSVAGLADTPKAAEAKANAAFIVKACNENADLHATVERMRSALVQVKHGAEYPDELGEIIDAAIALRDPAGKET